MEERHIEKVDEIKYDVFIQPTVITVKKDTAIKIVSDTRIVNEEWIKTIVNFQKLENPIELLAETIGSKESVVRFSSLDLTYTYGQTNLRYDLNSNPL